MLGRKGALLFLIDLNIEKRLIKENKSQAVEWSWQRPQLKPITL